MLRVLLVSLVSKYGVGAASVPAVPMVTVRPAFGVESAPMPMSELEPPAGVLVGANGVSVDAVTLARVAEPDDVERSPSATAWSGALPVNAVTGAAYRGKNIDRLLLAEAQGGYGPGGWAGFKQWLSVGRVVRKGEHGTACITVIGDRDSSSGDKQAAKGRGVRGFRVFHFDQTCELGEVQS